jgi:predicted metal-dependent phosphoesterase TrpH
MSKVKIDLHIHAKEDKEDEINYTSKQLIDKAVSLNFNALSLTFHNQFYYNKEISKYAERKGILLIPGVEMRIQGKDVLVYNITKKEFNKIKTLNDLRNIKKNNRNIFVIAPHPYFMTSVCLGNELERNIDLFDAIEHSWFFTKSINRNKKALKIALKYNKPFIATSDCHYLSLFGKTYAILESKNNIKSIFQAIKDKKITNYIRPLSFISLNIHVIKILLGKVIPNKYK